MAKEINHSGKDLISGIQVNQTIHLQPYQSMWVKL